MVGGERFQKLSNTPLWLQTHVGLVYKMRVERGHPGIASSLQRLTKMDMSKYSMDLALVPLSLCLTAGYHAYVYRCFTTESHHHVASARISMLHRKWFQTVVKEDSKKGMLGVQSLRNSLMSAILSASVAVVLNASLAALCNNAFSAGSLLRRYPPALVGNPQAAPLLVLKYASASMLLLASFLCSSAAVGCMVEANFLVNVPGGLLFPGPAGALLERGWLLAAAGSRVLWVTLSLLLWVLGPVPMAMSSAAMLWVFYHLDFAGGARLSRCGE
uniref:Protein MON2 n=1 Tax=Anthurium amnicola TaxID=1678845 RepID=A0A1D1YYF1_9ARAE